MQLLTREISIEHAKRIRFLVGANQKLALSRRYVSEINKLVDFYFQLFSGI